jgi:phenylacetate-CoA ligase
MTAINFHDDIFDQIKQFQFYQKKRGEVTFRYIPKDSFEWGVLGGIGQRLKTKLGHSTNISFEQVNEIPLTVRGKHRVLIQDIKG